MEIDEAIEVLEHDDHKAVREEQRSTKQSMQEQADLEQQFRGRRRVTRERKAAVAAAAATSNAKLAKEAALQAVLNLQTEAEVSAFRLICFLNTNPVFSLGLKMIKFVELGSPVRHRSELKLEESSRNRSILGKD